MWRLTALAIEFRRDVIPSRAPSAREAQGLKGREPLGGQCGTQWWASTSITAEAKHRRQKTANRLLNVLRSARSCIALCGKHKETGPLGVREVKTPAMMVLLSTRRAVPSGTPVMPAAALLSISPRVSAASRRPAASGFMRATREGTSPRRVQVESVARSRSRSRANRPPDDGLAGRPHI
jgi:hypothetical protein